MPLQDPGKIHALIVDDFSSFRSTMSSMLNKLGVKNIEEASKAHEVLKWCKDRKFDLILCDYNLGPGKNGQHVLEELRFRKLISHNTLFIMVTAEASKDMVLSAYDCEPDDYLMKPLNLHVLEQRISRLLQMRDALANVYQLLDQEEFEKAVDELNVLVNQHSRQTVIAQKLLGETLIRLKRYSEAETLYREVLENRRLDWAVLGLAKVHYAQGDKDSAKTELRDLIDESNLFLPAHDALSEILTDEQDLEALQATMERVVEVCPRSILRQRKLAEVAESNGDVVKTLQAANHAIKLGEHSCHQDNNDSLRFLNAAAKGLEHNIVVENMDLVEESKRCLSNLMASNRLPPDQEIQARLLMARVHALAGRPDEAKNVVKDCVSLAGSSVGKNIDLDIAYVGYLNSIGQTGEADSHLKAMAECYESDPASLEKIDKLTPEPRTENNRRRVAQLNKTGIELYKDGHYDDALDFFGRACMLFPRHVGLQLNRLQTLISKVKSEPTDPGLREYLQDQLAKVEAMLASEQNPAHMDRFRQLRDKARQIG